MAPKLIAAREASRGTDQGHTASTLRCLVFVPGFFAYQALIAATPVPSFFGGGAGVATVVTALTFALAALRQRQRLLQLRGALEPLVAVLLTFLVD